ncbi:hypothetical protein CPLU01_03546, partial [Colletotrichum plurivorum]
NALPKISHRFSIKLLSVADFGLGNSPCSTCRSRKKRCYHLENPEGAAVATGGLAARGSASRSPAGTSELSPSPGRVSPYNPESVLEDLSGDPQPGSAPEQLAPCPRHTIPTPAEVTPRQPGNEHAAVDRVQRQLFWHMRQRQRAASPELSDHYRRYLKDVGALLALPKSTTDALLPIYVTFLDDLIPIMKGLDIVRDYSNGRSSTYLVKAMCLVVCKEKQAAPFLRLKDGGPVMEPLQFAAKLLAGLDAAMKANLEPDRVIRIQILALMHLHNDGLGGLDRSSSHLSQAICEAWSISLHLNLPGNPDQERSQYLWWSLRNFDRLNKPIMGASPFMIDDTDISIERPTSEKEVYRSQLMAVSFLLGDLMTKATKVYKASSTATVDDCMNFPSLSELTANTGYETFHSAHSAYLEIWYHVAAMLSCRYSGPGSLLYSRRLASADKVLGLISRKGPEGLPSLPLVPYAVSMATTVIYRALRDGRRDAKSTHKDLGVCCDALDALSHQWTTTRGVAKLARRLREFIVRDPVNTQTDSAKQCSCGGREQADCSVSECASAAQNMNQAADMVTSNIGGLDASRSCDPSACRIQEEQGQQLFVNSNPQIQPTGNWEREGVSYLQFDTVFFDLFDAGIPEAFQDPDTWDSFHWTGAEQSFPPL